MEIIPVFSLIVLVATIGTFILAVGAYVLFKVRERRGDVENEAGGADFDAEIVAPSPYVVAQADAVPAPTAPSRREYPADQQRTRYGNERPSHIQPPKPDDRERWR